jgi:hypothetical protein
LVGRPSTVGVRQLRVAYGRGCEALRGVASSGDRGAGTVARRVLRFHGLHDNIAHMLEDCLTVTAKPRHVEDLLTTMYGPDWLPKLEGAAKREAAKRERKR